MKSSTIVKYYEYTFDVFDVYDHKSGELLYTSKTDPEIKVKKFSVYENIDGRLVLELYI